MPARLVPLNDPNGSPIPLQRPVLLIGRHPECDVRLERPQISRRHCCVALAYDRMTIRDLGSRNGVRVNGVRVEEALLAGGDEIAISHLIYRYEDSEPPRPGVAPPVAGSAEPPKDAAPLVAEIDEDDMIPIDDDLFPLQD
jgi:hypothetical protein